MAKKKRRISHRQEASRSAKAAHARLSEDPRTPALAARARQRGLADTKENRLGSTAVHLGDDIGRCLQNQCPEDAPELWAIWARFTTSVERYNRRCLGMTQFAKTAKIEMTPEPLEADQSHTIDERTEEERDADALKSYRNWCGTIGEMGSVEERALLWQMQSGLGHIQVWSDSGPTARGLRLVTALRNLKDVLDA